MQDHLVMKMETFGSKGQNTLDKVRDVLIVEEVEANMKEKSSLRVMHMASYTLLMSNNLLNRVLEETE